MSPLITVPVVPTPVPFLINVPADTITLARCPLTSPHTVTGADLYKIFGLALVMAGIEKLFGTAPVPFVNVLGVRIVNESISEIL